MNPFIDKFISGALLLSSLTAVTFVAEGKPATPIPVSAFALSAQDQQTLMALSSDTETATPLVWKGDPLPLHLSLNREQRLVFPEPVQIDVNGQLTTAQLRVINDHRNVYLTALTPFPKITRLYVTLKESGQIIFFDVDTLDSASHTPANTKPIAVRVAASLKKTSEKSLNPDILHNDSTNDIPEDTNIPSFSAELTPLSTLSADDLVQAIRFAWRQLYAPAYLLPNTLNFQRVPLHSAFWVAGLFYSDAVFAHPMASWVNNQVIVTVVELRNPTPQVVNLSIDRDLCGHWQAALLFPRSILQPVNNKKENSTSLFLVSSEPFAHALGVCHGRV